MSEELTIIRGETDSPYNFDFSDHPLIKDSGFTLDSATVAAEPDDEVLSFGTPVISGAVVQVVISADDEAEEAVYEVTCKAVAKKGSDTAVPITCGLLAVIKC
jgi:hypothetical protein